MAQFVKQHTVPISHTVGGLTLDSRRQRLVVRTEDTMGPLKSFTYGGQMFQSLGVGVSELEACGDCRGIAFDTRRDLYMVPCDGVLKLIGMAGNMHKSITVGSTANRGVAYGQEKDVYYVSEYGPNGIHMINPEDLREPINFGQKPSESSHNVTPYNIHVGKVAGVERPCLVYSDNSNHCIKLYETSSKNIWEHGSSIGADTRQLKSPWGVSTDSQGRLFICDQGNKRVVSFTRDSDGEELWNSVLADDWNGKRPRHLALDNNAGVLAVVDTGNVLHIYAAN